MRADIGDVMPTTQGAEAFLEDIWSSKPHLLAKIVTLGEAVKRDGAQPALRLPPPELPEPDLKNADSLQFTLLAGHADSPQISDWAKENGFGADALCLTRQAIGKASFRASG